MDPITSSLVALLVSSVASIVGYFFKRRSTEEREKLTHELDKIARERWEFGVSIGPVSWRKVVEPSSELSASAYPELLRSIEEQVVSRIATSSGLAKEDAQKEIDNQLSQLQDRFAKIESRFPEEAKLEKIASINDALLSERIDQLAKQVEGLEKRILSKWDVALTVSTMIAGIAFVVAATYGVLKIVDTGHSNSAAQQTVPGDAPQAAKPLAPRP